MDDLDMKDLGQEARPSPSFNPTAYWSARVREPEGLAEVGHRALGSAYNAVIYRRRLEAIQDILTELSLEPRATTILDLGCGTGFYERFWHATGVARLTGVDISQRAVEGLRARFPQYTFHHLDISARDWPSHIEGRFSLITLIDVVYHLLDDAAAQRLLVSCAQLLTPDGILLLTEAGVWKRTAIAPHVVFRSREEWTTMLAVAGLRLDHRIPLFQLLEPPLSRYHSLSVGIAGAYKIAGFVLRRNPRFATALAERLAQFDARLLRRGAPLANQELWLLRSAGNPPPVSAQLTASKKL